MAFSPRGSLHGSYEATITSITPSYTSQVILNSNPTRNGAIIYNGTDQKCFLAFKDTVSLLSYSFCLEPDSQYTFQNPIYAGEVAVIWENLLVPPAVLPVPNGKLFVTEMV